MSGLEEISSPTLDNQDEDGMNVESMDGESEIDYDDELLRRGGYLFYR